VSRRLDEYALQFKLVVQAQSKCPTLGGRRSTPAHSGLRSYKIMINALTIL
jgi:hypothetical protein